MIPASWRTSLAGLIAIILLILGKMGVDLSSVGISPDNLQTGGLVTGLVGLLFARDNNVTSEKAGAK
jgi:hypothetical protein